MKAKKSMVAKAIGGRTARPCDHCMRERARWYCAADEAYLCEHCDGSVHSANSVARRHERVQIAASCAKLEADFNGGLIFPGARKRARSSRPHPHGAGQRSVKSKLLGAKDELAVDPPGVPVPVDSSAGDINLNLRVDDDDYDYDDDELLPEVPTFVPMADELRGSRTRDLVECPVVELKADCGGVDLGSCDFDQFLNSETDLSGFGVDMDMDVESIIGHGLVEGLSVLGFCSSNWDEKRNSQLRDLNERINDGSETDQHEERDNGTTEWLNNNRAVKAEEDEDRPDDLCSKLKEEGDHHAAALKAKVEPDEPDQSWDTIELDLDQYHEDDEEELEDATGLGDQYNCMAQGAADEHGYDYQDIKIELDPGSIMIGEEKMCSETKLVSLRLNYEDVLIAWSDRGSPWASLHDCNSDAGGSQDAGLVPELGLSYSNGQLNIIEGGGGLGQEDSCRHGGGGREARVLRYREKRRTRLFSKKIRYEVRKLNAEKRPRMKGRFVKRTPGMFCD